MSELLARLLGGSKEDGPHSILKKFPMFHGLSNRDLAQIERVTHRKTYRAEEVIFREGEPGLGMYMIESGTVEIVGGPFQQPIQLREGGVFGELDLLEESPRMATAVTKTPCTMLGFFQPDLLGLIQRNPRLGVKLLLRHAQFMARRVRAFLMSKSMDEASGFKNQAG